MARFLNEYTCPKCEHEWQDEWSSMVDDQCPECGLKNISPDASEELDEDED